MKLINSQWHKLCRGPAHDEPTYLPANDKYFYRYKSGARRGVLYSQCRLCHQWRKLKDPKIGSAHGLVEAAKARPIVIEAVNRVGLVELARRTGLSDRAVSQIVLGQTKMIRKATLRQIMLELVSIRRKKEFSISPWAAWRVTRRGVGNAGTCTGCGTTFDNFTQGCDVCDDRKAQRKRRGLTSS